MACVRYKVVDEFDPEKDYGRNITRQVAQCLESLEEGREFNPKEITLEHESDDSLMMVNPNFLRAKCIVSEAMDKEGDSHPYLWAPYVLVGNP